MTLGESWASITGAKSQLEGVLDTPWFSPAIRNAARSGQNLLAALNVLTERSDFSEEIGFVIHQSIENSRVEFETILRAELSNADAYYVSRKSAYDTTALIVNAESLFSSDINIKVPTSIAEIREAGKCLAFELTTASGFHIFRATEIVLRAYWKHVSDDAPPPKMQSIGRYATHMEEKKKGSEKVVSALKQINSLHRNPLIHPEVSLTLDEAVGLIGICVSAVNQMLREMPVPPPPPLVPLGEVVH